MQYRIHNKSGAEVSLLGLGCMRLPKPDPSSEGIDYAAAKAMVDTAWQRGIRYFDTAWAYHGGESELFIGKALKDYPRDSFFLADKMPAWALESKEDREKVFSRQLEKCGVDYFDFYLLHSVQNSNWDKYEELEVYNFLAQKKAEGKIRRLGFSYHGDVPLLETILKTHEWDFVQIQLNYLDWELQDAKTQYRLITEAGLQCMIMEPVRGGALADLCPEANAILQKAAPGRSIASWAIRFAAGLPGVLCVLSGMSTPEQLEDNLSTMDAFTPLSDAEKEALDAALAEYRKARTIPCTGCRYCLPCPMGVAIPDVFRLYNHKYAFSHSAESLKNAVGDMEGGPAACVACGQCLDKCPQSIAIPTHMQEICELVK